MNKQQEPVSEEDFQFLYKKEIKDESLILDYIIIPLCILALLFIFYDHDFSFNLSHYFDINRMI